MRGQADGRAPGGIQPADRRVVVTQHLAAVLVDAQAADGHGRQREQAAADRHVDGVERPLGDGVDVLLILAEAVGLPAGRRQVVVANRFAERLGIEAALACQLLQRASLARGEQQGEDRRLTLERQHVVLAHLAPGLAV
ncbi:hypothetical protein D9M71_570780 [compost metagenome]